MRAGRLPPIRFLGALLGSLRELRGLALAVLLLALASAFLESFSLLQVVPFLRGLTAGGSAASLRLVCELVLALVLLKGAAQFLYGVGSARFQIRLLARVRRAVAERIFRSSYRELLEREPGDLANFFIAQSEGYVSAVGGLVSLANSALALAAYAGVLVSLSWKMSLLVPVFALSAAGALAVCGRKVREHARRVLASEERLSRLVLDDLSALPVIKAFSLREERLRQQREAHAAEERDFVALHAWRSALRPLSESVAAAAILGGALLLLALRREWLFGHVPVLLGFAFVLFRMQGWIGALSQSLFDLSEWQAPASSLLEFLGDGESRGSVGGTRSLATPPSRIEATELSFYYGRSRAPVLSGVSLRIRSGETVALVGKSGSGKTTLAYLLTGLLQPAAGSVELDGLPLAEIRPEALSGCVAVVFEDSFLFNETIAWNIACGRELSPEAVARAARLAELHDFVESLPEGYGTRVGFRGLQLSAGQKQRLALARALAGEPRLLVLDEATGALDPATERAVLRNLRESGAGRMTLMATHRQGIVREADRVVVLDAGRVVASGAPGELPSVEELASLPGLR